MSKEIDRINERGFAGGWHAEQLKARALREGRTMADIFAGSGTSVSAFSVPARAEAIRGGMVHYRFLDGSTIRYPYQKRVKA